MTDSPDKTPENADATEPPERLADTDLVCGCGDEFETFHELAQHTARCEDGEYDQIVGD